MIVARYQYASSSLQDPYTPLLPPDASSHFWSGQGELLPRISRRAIVAQPHAGQSPLHTETMPLSPANRSRVGVRDIPEHASGTPLTRQGLDKGNTCLGRNCRDWAQIKGAGTLMQHTATGWSAGLGFIGHGAATLPSQCDH